MATRGQVREAVVQLLYAREMGNENVCQWAGEFLEERKIRNKQREFALSLLNGVILRDSILKRVISAFLEKWDINRLGIIEKSILKLGIYELLETETKEIIVINEAIELTRTFNVESASGLINGVLDSISKASADEIGDRVENVLKENMEKKISMQMLEDNVNNMSQKEEIHKNWDIKKSSMKKNKGVKSNIDMKKSGGAKRIATKDSKR